LLTDNLWTKSIVRGPWAPSVHHGPAPWPTSGAQPPATLGLKVTGEGAEEVAASTFVCSSELGRWGNSGAAERDGRRRSVIGEVGVADSGASKGG
jgi:hypothetical protein